MNIFGSFDGQNVDSYPTPDNAQFKDADGAGALLNTNPFNYGPWDTDRCLFVNATSNAQKYLLLSIVWTPKSNVALNQKFWINAEVPLCSSRPNLRVWLLSY
jgi:hypothetical protein